MIRPAPPHHGPTTTGIVFALLLAAGAEAQAPAPGDGRRVAGVVRDASGAPVAMAIVTLRGPGQTRQVAADLEGRFSLLWARFPFDMTVEADGFRPRHRRVGVVPDGPLVVVLERGEPPRDAPPAFADEVTITASRAPEGVGRTPASVTVLSKAELHVSPSLTFDDTLRQVPGFTLFRRTGSRGANPTAQGASLRGLGGSGASRAAVLEDGLSLNDPFGGWVYWSRVPQAAVDRIEVLRGGASDLYGSGALSGAVHFVRPRSDLPRFDAGLSWGGQDTGRASLFGTGRKGGFGLALAAEVFTTGGYFAVPAADRGTVDTPVATHHQTADLTLERMLGETGRIFVRGGRFRENRANGTVLQGNDTEIDQGIAGLDGRLLGGQFQVRGRLARQEFRQGFSAVGAGRDSERFTVAQRVPSRATEATVQWAATARGHSLLLGAERRSVRGSSEEDNFASGAPVRSVAGGRQRVSALFAEDAWRPWSRLTLTGGVRLDRWKNADGRQGPPASPRRLEDRSASAVSPRFGSLLRLSDSVALTAAYYRSFRAPTLNELYRGFRVGNVVTLPDEGLGPERLRGREAGLLFTFGSGFLLRATAFSMDASDTIANVTLSVTPALITRQRQNLGQLRSRGVEAEMEAHLGGGVRLAAAWMTGDAQVRRFPSDPSLEGLRIPQVPRHQGSVGLRRTASSGLVFAVQARYAGRQFDDDRNELPLGAYWVLDALVSSRINPWIDWYLAVENARDVEYTVGRTPTRTVGPPRVVRGGLRVRLRGDVAPP